MIEEYFFKKELSSFKIKWLWRVFFKKVENHIDFFFYLKEIKLQ